jgi:hypothetical protein
MGGETNSVKTLSIVSQISTCNVWLEVQKVNNRIANYLKLVIPLSVVNKLSKIITKNLHRFTSSQKDYTHKEG